MKRTRRRPEKREIKGFKTKYFVITNDYIFPIFIIFFVILSWFIVFRTQVFSIQNIYCQINYTPCTDPFLKAELDRSLGLNIIKYSADNLISKIKSNNPTIKEVSVTKNLPSSLSIDLTSTTPAVSLQLRNTDKWIIFDDTLRVITEHSSRPNLPSVIISDYYDFTVGQKVIDNNINEALTLALQISDNFMTPRTIELENTQLTLTFYNFPTALLTTSKSIPEQLLALQAILSDATIISEAVLIDVRFSQPVIKSD